MVETFIKQIVKIAKSSEVQAGKKGQPLTCNSLIRAIDHCDLGQSWLLIISCLLLMCYRLFYHSIVSLEKNIQCRQRQIDSGREDYRLSGFGC